MPLKAQAQLVRLFANLLSSGFTVTEMVDFLERSQLINQSYTQQMRQSLLSGRGLAELASDLGFSDQQVTQLALADAHGNTQQCLEGLAHYLEQVLLVRKKMLEVMTYPIILLGFLLFILLGLRHYLLPQLDGQHWTVKLIDRLPYLMLAGGLGLVSSGLVLSNLSKRTSALDWYSQLSHLPYVGELVRLYLTAYYAREWGNLLEQGLDLAQVVAVMQDQPARLFRAVGQDLEEALLRGQDFQSHVATYPFFRKELSLIIAYGEVKAKLGRELGIYAQETWGTFFSRLHQLSLFIQPLVFLAVAIIIVLIYAAMLLPIYQQLPTAV